METSALVRARWPSVQKSNSKNDQHPEANLHAGLPKLAQDRLCDVEQEKQDRLCTHITATKVSGCVPVECARTHERTLCPPSPRSGCKVQSVLWIKDGIDIFKS